MVAFGEESVAIQCPPLRPFRIEGIQLLTVFSMDGSFVQQVGPSVYDRGPGLPPSLFPYALLRHVGGAPSPTNQLKPHVPKSAREHR